MSKSVILLFVLALFVGVSGVFAQEDLIVFYHGEQTTFQDLEEKGIITHCMDDISQPGAGVVLCFDSREERNAAFETLWNNEVGAQARISGRMFFYANICYSGLQYTVLPDQANILASTYSISRDGQIAVELYRYPFYNASGGTWVVADSHCTIGTWAGNGIKSARRLW